MNDWNGRYKHPAFWIATGFGSGLLKPAPGTWGTLAAVLIAWPIAHLAGAWGVLAITILSVPIGIWAAQVYNERTGTADSGSIVIDEFSGMWIALLPQAFMMPGINQPGLWILVSFILFRLLDIIKPWPIGWLDKNIKGGLGVMIDDIVAGVMAAIIMAILLSHWGYGDLF